MCSWPSEKVQVDLHAMVQVWQPMQRLMLKTAANCHFGCASGKRNSISRPSCQLYTCAIGGLSVLVAEDVGDESMNVIRSPLAVDRVAGGEGGQGEELEDALRRPAHQGELLDKAARHGVRAVVAGRGDGDGDRRPSRRQGRPPSRRA